MSPTYSSSAEKIDVGYVAHLARLHLDEEEKNRLQQDLEHIIGYVDELKKIDVENIEPTAHAVPVENVLREDRSRESLDRDVALKNAPSERSGQFVVPKIIE